MKKVLLLMLLALTLASCSSEPPADQIVGSYNCEARLYTRYKKGDQWRDTSYVSKQNNTVVITKVDDNTVAVKASSKKWGDAVVEKASCSDYNYEASFGGTGTLAASGGHNYDADISGTVSYDSRALSVSARVTNYPNSGGKYILSFTNVVN
ncbi:MAG: hypothetical protein IJ634_02665 [Bacteroidales bacterium]|nr:hypothetical protein [Bacteroidales bacterium]